MSGLIDTHSHLISHKYSKEETGSLIQKARERGLSHIITLGTEVAHWQDHLRLAKQYPDFISVALGIHPCDVHDYSESERLLALETLRQEAQQKHLVAIGETGLDYFHPSPKNWNEPDFRQRQRQSLEEHYALAAELGLNIVVHTRDKSGIDSFNDTLAIATRYAEKVRSLFHCFIGNMRQAEQIFALDGIISFTGIVTFKNALDVLSVAKNCPVGKFVIETDSPYLAPEPHRGQRNEPAYVADIAAFLAREREESLEDFYTHTTNTAKAFFTLPHQN